MKKISKEKVARIYSTALYEAAVAGAQLDEVRKDIEFLSGLCKQDKELMKKVSSPLINVAEQKEIWHQVAGKLKFNDETLRFLDVLADEGRIGYLSAIAEDFVHLYYENNNIAEVRVETVKKLSADQDKKLRDILKNKLDKDVVIEYVINPAILGGLRIQNGSKMFDGSLYNKLNCLENLMKGK